MTDPNRRTYVGDLPAGTIALPARSVRFRRGESVAFTAEEAAILPAEWIAEPPAATPPDGPPATVLAWVDGDPARAALALEAEEARPRRRKSLVSTLTELAATNTTTSADGADTEEP